MTPPLTAHIAALTRFAETHLTGADDDALIRLKLDHSLRVLDNAEAIVAGEAITGHAQWLCRMAALYHDIGRFPQFARYHTFTDRTSVNHGRMGVLTLRGFAFPEPVAEADARRIRFTVGQHNVKSLNPHLPPALAVPVHVVRDADKLDIYRVMEEHFHSDHRNPEVTQGIDTGTDAYSNDVYETVMRGENGDYSQIRQTNDFVLLLIGWFARLHYRTTRRLAVRRGHLNAFFALLPDDAKIRALRARTDILIRETAA